MKFTIGYLVFMSITILIVGMWSSHKKDSVADFSEKEESTEYVETDYSSIIWEELRP